MIKELFDFNNIRNKYEDKLKCFNLYLMAENEFFFADKKWERNYESSKTLSADSDILLIGKRKTNDDYIGIIFKDNQIINFVLIHGWENGFYTILNVYKTFEELLSDEERFN
jgi:hypothetical protein